MVGLLIDWPVNRSWTCWWESLPGMCRKRWNCCWDVVGMMSPGSTDALSSYMWFYNFLSWWLSYLFPWKWTSAQTCFCCAVTSARVEAFVEATCKSWWKKSHCKSISSLRLRWDNSMGNHLFGILGMSIDECMFFFHCLLMPWSVSCQNMWKIMWSNWGINSADIKQKAAEVAAQMSKEKVAMGRGILASRHRSDITPSRFTPCYPGLILKQQVALKM